MRYKFRYFGYFKQSSMISGIIQNFWLPWMIYYILHVVIVKILILSGFDDLLNNNALLFDVKRIILICSISSVVFFCLFRKGVFLNQNSLLIARYTITQFNWKWWIKIDYNDIEKVNVNYFDISWYNYNFRMLTLGGDRAYNVELTLKNSKKYFFSIEDQEEFCDNLNQLIENSKNMY